MPVGEICGYPAALCPDYEAFLDEERLVNFLESALVLPYRSGYGVGTDRAALERTDDGPQYLVVYGIKPAGVYPQFVEGEPGDREIDVAVPLDLGILLGKCQKCPSFFVLEMTRS